MLIADTEPLVAMLNANDRHHEACTALSGGSTARSSSRPQ
jgi:hypothetical protein